MVVLPWLLAISTTGMVTIGCKNHGDTADTADSGTPSDGGTSTLPTDDTGTAPQGITIDVTLDASLIDQCRSVCGQLRVSGSTTSLKGVQWTVESDIDGFLNASGQLDANGHADFCLGGPLSSGLHQLAFQVDPGSRNFTILPLEVRPFGWAYGLDKPLDALQEIPWVPKLDEAQLTADPVFPYAETPKGSDAPWDSYSVLSPGVVRFNDKHFLYYAGTSDVNFSLGVASSDGITDFSRYTGNPILVNNDPKPGAWDYYAQNTPEPLVHDGQVWLYYNGRSEDAGGLNIGLAKSDDGFTFTDAGINPVLAPTGIADDFDGAGVAHPSVTVRDVDFTDNDEGATQVFELWYASGTLKIGYAISADGTSFERYCGGPAFQGNPSGWDHGQTKAPEVERKDGHYFMTYSGCGQGCYQVGWAASDDGIRWVALDEPFIPVTPIPEDTGDTLRPWNSYGTQEAFIEINDDDSWRFWYAGTGNSHGSISYVDALP